MLVLKDILATYNNGLSTIGNERSGLKPTWVTTSMTSDKSIPFDQPQSPTLQNRETSPYLNGSGEDKMTPCR